MTARYLLAEATTERDRYRRALEAVLEACEAADLLGMLLYPADLREAISRAYGESPEAAA